MIDFSKQIKFLIESWSILFCLFSATVILIGAKMARKTKIYFLSIFLGVAVVQGLNITRTIFESFPAQPERSFLYLITFGEYLFGYALSSVFTLFLLFLIRTESTRKLTKAYIAAGAIFSTAAILLTVSQFTGILYYLDADLTLQKGPFYVLSLFPVLAALAMDSILLIRFFDLLPGKTAVFLSCCVIFPLTALSIQPYTKGLSPLSISFTLSAIILLILVWNNQSDRYLRKEREAAQMRSAIMVSQIQPHFLHNSLTSIAQLCEKDPKTAKNAVIFFSEYLRGNMDSLKEKNPIPFSRELDHLKHYLYLEKMRFGEYLELVLDIHAIDFKLPVLSLQPLVENAIRHGIGMREDGGKITISSLERPDHYEVRITDDGVGFDVSASPPKNEQHIGIQNVRKRLETMCGGTLTVTSTPGLGTTTTILIPKEVHHENTRSRRRTSST